MELVKKTDDFSIFKKKNNRFGVKNKSGKWINGDEKAKILLGASLIKISEPKKVEEPVVEEAAPVEAAAQEAAPAEATAEEAPATEEPAAE